MGLPKESRRGYTCTAITRPSKQRRDRRDLGVPHEQGRTPKCGGCDRVRGTGRGLPDSAGNSRDTTAARLAEQEIGAPSSVPAAGFAAVEHRAHGCVDLRAACNRDPPARAKCRRADKVAPSLSTAGLLRTIAEHAAPYEQPAYASDAQ
jgi:hypothetical protein